MNTTPQTSEIYSQEIEYYNKLHAEKYRDVNQSRLDHITKLASNLASNEEHYNKLWNSLSKNRFLPAGRVQAAFGATQREVSPFNCSVSQHIDDSMESIMAALSNAAKTLRLGTGIGYNFSSLRPKGTIIEKLKTKSSGPLSFMKIFDVMASTIASSGHRRGAQMGIMNVDHPDIEEFIDAKMQKDTYRQFNLSVGITDAFMEAVAKDQTYNLIFEKTTYKTIGAKGIWQKIIKNAYESAEPGIIFIDRLNKENNLYYCEEIEATNPCSEQPLPPYGLCTLGSFNLMAYIQSNVLPLGTHSFNYLSFIDDISIWVEAYDNIFERAVYAIPEHRQEALCKRRIGLGLTGIANAIELIHNKPNYGEIDFCSTLDNICNILKDRAYLASVKLAQQRGTFSLFNKEQYLQSKFIKTLNVQLQYLINEYGIRNSHLISYAPCGTISQIAGNVSSGVEPVFYYEMSRDIYMKSGKQNMTLTDFNFRNFNFKGKTLEQCTIDNHLNVAEIIQKHCDSAVSKTINVPTNCSYEDYSQIYTKAYELGLKGITVYRPSELRGAVIVAANNGAIKNENNEIISTVPSNCLSGVCSM